MLNLPTRVEIDLGPSPEAADALSDLADAMDLALFEQAQHYRDEGERIPGAVLTAGDAVERAADLLRQAALLINAHCPSNVPF